MNAMLDGIRVIELADDSDAAAAAAYCGRILADLGADVIKIEPPGGDPLRATPPFVNGVAGPDRSLCWIALNANKRGVVVDRGSRDGERRFRWLVERSDIVVTADPRLDRARLATWNDQVILAVVTPFGVSGPLNGARASDLVQRVRRFELHPVDAAVALIRTQALDARVESAVRRITRIALRHHHERWIELIAHIHGSSIARHGLL